MRIFHLLQGLEVGGLERAVLNLLESMHNEHYVHAVICYDRYGKWAARVEARGIRVLLEKRHPGVDLRYALKVARLLRHERADILHLHNETALFYGVLAGKLARVPVIIYTEHDGIFPGKPSIIRLNKLLTRGVDQIVPVSNLLGNRLVQEKQLSTKKVQCIVYGIDEQQFEYLPDRNTARLRLGLAPDEKVIGIVARLEPEKNHRMLLRAFKKVRSVVSPARLLIVGEGSLRGHLEAMANELGIGERVLFLGDRQDVALILPALDIFVLCSVSEGLPLSVLEAMAASKPVVATNVGGVSEAVENGVNGLLVRSNDMEAFAGAMIALLENAPLANDMGKKGRDIFQSKFTLVKMVKSYQHLYDRFYKEKVLGYGP